MKLSLCLSLILLLSVSVFSADVYDSIKTTNGKEYFRVRVMSKTPDGLKVIHSRGAGKILFKDLPADLQKKYGYDAAKAEAYAKKIKEAKAKAIEAKKAREEALKKAKIEKERGARRQKAEALAKKNELMAKLYREGVPCFSEKRVFLRKISGASSYSEKLEMMIKLDGYYFYKGDMYIKPKPVPEEMADFKDKLEKKLTAAKKAVAKGNSAIKDAETKINELKATVEELLELDRQASADLPLLHTREISQKKNEIRELEREIRKQKKDNLDLVANEKTLQKYMTAYKKQIAEFTQKKEKQNEMNENIGIPR